MFSLLSVCVLAPLEVVDYPVLKNVEWVDGRSKLSASPVLVGQAI